MDDKVKAQSNLELWAWYTQPEMEDIMKNKAITLNKIRSHEEQSSDAVAKWLTFRPTPQGARERAQWYNLVPIEERFLVRVTVTVKGVGHFTKGGSLTHVARYGTWRFHEDVPFEVFDDEHDLLLRVDPAPRLELWACYTEPEMEDIMKKKAITLNKKRSHEEQSSDAVAKWLTFRSTPEAARERAQWYNLVPIEERFLVRVTVTVKGVGHFTKDGRLTHVPRHGTWRFHEDVPFEVFDDENDLLLRVDLAPRVPSQD